MNRVVAAIVAGLAIILVVALLLFRSSTPPPADSETAAAPQPADAPSAPAAPTASAPVAEAPRAAPRRTPAPTEAPAAPAAEPVAEAPPPPANVATLRIDSDVPGAQIFIDRQFVGTAPATAENVAPGTHQLNVSAQGFEGIAQTIEVSPGTRDITVRFREVKLDAKLSVIHKHRIGDCKGELTATPQGLRYTTSDKDDAFTVAMADLETFQVDYLQKTLRVKIRKGKQFNFTDPEGNADRLFVFHRDVDKARTRLAAGDKPAQ